MARPTNKMELIALSNDLFNKLISTIEALDNQHLDGNFTEDSLNKNVRDVLMHLYEWHSMFMSWYQVGMAGGKPIMPTEGYTWKTTPELNIFINQKYQNTSVFDSIQKIKKSHSAVLQIIQQHSNEELFEKKRYSWTGSTSLGSYIISATSSHYDWALKFLKKNGIKHPL